MPNQNEYIKAIQQEYIEIQNLRKRERDQNLQYNAFKSIPTIAKDELRSNFEKVLPPHLVPSNVGNLSAVKWPFTYEFLFDFQNSSGNVVLEPNKVFSSKFQVSNESAFCITSIYRTFPTDNASGFEIPMTISFKDTQSSRQFNDEPIPFQAIGYQSNPTKFDVPKLILPNATFTAECKTWLKAPLDLGAVSGKHSIICQGFRIRLSDINSVFKAIFK